MYRISLAAIALLAAVVCASGARLPLQAAPAPSASQPKADLLFIISANTAEFMAEGQLVLRNASETAQFTNQGGRSGIYPISYFTNTTAGSPFVTADGQWLDVPQAALYGSPAPGNQSVVLLTLDRPHYDTQTETLILAYNLLPATHSGLKYSGGAVGTVVDEAQSNTGVPLLATIAPGTKLNGAALFIDSNQMAMQPKAETKFGGWWFPWWGGYQPGYYQQPPYYGGYNNGYGYPNGGGYNNGGETVIVNNNNNNNNGK